MVGFKLMTLNPNIIVPFTANTITLEQGKIWEFSTSCFPSHLIGPWHLCTIFDWLLKYGRHASGIYVDLAGSIDRVIAVKVCAIKKIWWSEHDVRHHTQPVIGCQCLPCSYVMSCSDSMSEHDSTKGSTVLPVLHFLVPIWHSKWNWHRMSA